MTTDHSQAKEVSLHRRTFWLEAKHYDWRALTGGRKLRKLPKESVLFHQDSPVHAVYVIAHGRVRLVTYSEDGKERHVVVVGAGGLVGDWGMLDPGRHLTGAVVSAEAGVYEAPVSDLLHAMQTDRIVLTQVLAFSDQRLQAMLQHHDLLSAGPAIKRVALALMGLAHVHGVPHPRGLRLQVRFTQSEMASICSISRMSVSTVLSTLFARGLLLRDGPWLVVPDLAALDSATLQGGLEGAEANTQTSASPKRPLT